MEVIGTISSEIAQSRSQYNALSSEFPRKNPEVRREI